jgi:hypothetical protein
MLSDIDATDIVRNPIAVRRCRVVVPVDPKPRRMREFERILMVVELRRIQN